MTKTETTPPEIAICGLCHQRLRMKGAPDHPGREHVHEDTGTEDCDPEVLRAVDDAVAEKLKLARLEERRRLTQLVAGIFGGLS